MKKTHVIFDLDNCISDDGWRIPEIHWSKVDVETRYDTYHQLAGFDRIGNLDVVVDRLFNERLTPIFLTARPTRYHAITRRWLQKYGLLRPDYVLMTRPDNDHRPSPVLKAEMVKMLPIFFETHIQQIVMAYDDREDVLEAYKELCIPTQKLFIHEQIAHIKPEDKQ